MAKTEQNALKQADEQTEIATVELAQFDIKNLIYVVRNQQVMVDSDLAMLYQVETGNLNKAMKRNQNTISRGFLFPINQRGI